jgi:hypothetical protein
LSSLISGDALCSCRTCPFMPAVNDDDSHALIKADPPSDFKTRLSPGGRYKTGTITGTVGI